MSGIDESNESKAVSLSLRLTPIAMYFNWLPCSAENAGPGVTAGEIAFGVVVPWSLAVSGNSAGLRSPSLYL
jgi:hypothetical protein